MKPIAKAVRSSFILALVLSAALVAGIPAIILGATNQIWAVMAIGIVCTVLGFYGCPVAWVAYGGKRSLYRLVHAVTDEHIYTVAELAQQLSISEKEVRSKLTVCFQKNYLPGYKRSGDEILLNENEALSETLYAAECPHCGAKFSHKGTKAACPYCGTLIVNKN